MTAVWTPDPLRSPTTQRYFLHAISTKSPMHHDRDSRDCSPTSLSPDDLPSTPGLSDDELILPYESRRQSMSRDLDVDSDASVPSTAGSWPTGPLAADDSSVEEEPSRHVDYLSHEWREEDIWASWRYVTTRKKDYSNGVRLENASWRTWAKAKHHLGTISPETLNWLKDCDVTWLYGPLKTSCSCDTLPSDASPPPSRLETPNSYVDRKPILKKRTASETILQRSLSQRTLLQHAGAILKAQEANGWARPPFPRSHVDLDAIHHRTGSSTYSGGGTLTTTTSSGLTSPGGERRHIHFNNEVEQCIAVEAKDGYEAEWPPALEDESSEDEVVFLRQISGPASISSRSTPRNSFGSDGKTIAPLPSTTLKCRGETPEPTGSSLLDRWATCPTSSLSPSPSVETLRPSPSPSPSANFLVDDEDPSIDFTGHDSQPQSWLVPEESEFTRPMQLTSSGMFMPYGEEEGDAGNTGLLGRVVDTLNTARDIAHVVWNVGWRR
ncbi:hypothetical protein N7492_007868 [Penicillium capsulatum]|uniref:Nitrogen regulatory protein areA GATA-like domain-containing protein n=1 Tax=Penicillium capsulatum TaxID=69766 RepID=A0A9W9I2Q2_9EURO|nr:hypothetical protein N7492_007868 [Penicillium capsulatum]KAJ6117699.1 hypothetical protein N7512_007424 [Penicillium capsulatum]